MHGFGSLTSIIVGGVFFSGSLADTRKDRLYLWHILWNHEVQLPLNIWETVCLLHIGSIFRYLNVTLFSTMWQCDCDTSLTRVNLHTQTCTHTKSQPRIHLHPFCSTVNRLLVKVTAKAHAWTGIPTQELLFLSFHVTILNGPLCCREELLSSTN